MTELNNIYNKDCLEGIKDIPDNSIDCILTDPPYLYLKNQKLDRPFDEDLLFSEFKRVLKPNGFVLLFGRGASFYKWNTILSSLGFTFKEEIIWDKTRNSCPFTSMSRVHETISIHTKGNGVINKVKVPYLDMKRHDIASICQDIKRLRSVLKNTKSFDAVLNYLEKNQILNDGNRKKLSITVGSVIKNKDVNACVMRSIKEGMNEKSIIRESGDHYKSIHPTQKPVRLLERLLALTTNIDDIVLDPFSGSCSTAISCINTGRIYVGFEIDKEYYDLGTKRINCVLNQLR